MNTDQSSRAMAASFLVVSAILRSFGWSFIVNALLAALLLLFFVVGSVGISIAVQIIGAVGSCILTTFYGSDPLGALIPYSFVVAFLLSVFIVAGFRFVHLYFLHHVAQEITRTV